MENINNESLNALDYGVNDTDYSVQTLINLGDDEIINPFFVELNSRDLDKIEPRDLHKLYDCVYVLCMRDDFMHNFDTNVLFNKILKKNDYLEFSKYLTLYKCSKNLLKNKLHYNQAKIVSKDNLMIFSNPNYKFENTEIIVPLYELKLQGVVMYNNLYEPRLKLNQIEDILSLLKYYSVNPKGVATKNFSNMLSELKESDFWKNSFNCNINMTELFSKRSFQYKEIQNDNMKTMISTNNIVNRDSVVQKVVDKLSDMKKPYDLESTNTREVFTDIAGALFNDTKRTYFATNPQELEFNKEKITELLLKIENEKELYDVFNSLLVSKDYCHSVLNNERVLEKMTPIFNKYSPIYKYLFGYGWLSLYTEECIFKTRTQKENRYVFDINTASKLPIFPFCVNDIHQNPYMSVAISENALNSSTNCLSLPMIENHDGYGICNLDDFKKRMNIFTSGDPQKNLLNDIDWTSFGISGSIITACLMKRSPLFDYVTNANQSETEKWLTYFNHYYGESDIDLMCNKSSVFEFIDNVPKITDSIVKNIGGNVIVESVKSMAVIITSNYLIERLEHIREYTGTQWTVEDVIKNISSDRMKEYFYRLYCDAKLEYNKKYRVLYPSDKNEYYNCHYKLASIDDMHINLVTYEIDKNNKVQSDSEICYFVNDFRSENNKLPESQNLLSLKISENIKFKIRGDNMLHNIETFRVRNSDFFNVVAKFHLPCVRGYFTNNNVYLLPSCITAMMTGINIDYKYFAGVRDPIDILNKYRMRGFGVLLNKKELNHMIYYIKNIPKWNEIFKVPTNRKQACEILFGAKNINHDMFKPLIYKGHMRDIYQVKEHNYIMSVLDLIKYYREKHNYNVDKSIIDVFKLKVINKDGNVEPLKSWVSQAYYEMMN